MTAHYKVHGSVAVITLFLGAVPPQRAFVEHLVARLADADEAPAGVTPQAQALAQALWQRQAG